MRSDQLTAAAEIERLWNFAAERAERGEHERAMHLVSLVALARYVCRNQVVASAAGQLVASPRVSDSKVSKDAALKIWSQYSERARELAQVLERVLAEVARSEPAGAAIEKQRADLRQRECTWSDRRTVVMEVVHDLRVGALAPTELRDIGTFCSPVLASLSGLANVVQNEFRAAAQDGQRADVFDDLARSLSCLQNEIASAYQDALSLVSFAHNDGHDRAFAVLQGLDRLESQLTEGDYELPLNETSPTRAVMQYLPNVERFVAALVAMLREVPIRSHVLARLHVFLERFDRERLLSETATDRGKAELLLQRAVDQFVFSEGLYPITHCEASGGKIDTFVGNRAELFADLAERHEPAVLIELKQVLDRPRPGRSAIRRAVEVGLHQAQIYSTEMRSNAAWIDHHVATVVAYTGPTRYRTARDGVYLVYLGAEEFATPHKGAKPLFPEDEA